MSETFYELLGVSTDASEEDIERAYRDLVTEVHPDVTDDPDAGERFQRLTRARDVLTDPTERQRYDRMGHTAYVAAEEGARTDEQDGTGQTNTSGGSGPRGPGSETDTSGATAGQQSGRARSQSSGSRTTSERAGPRASAGRNPGERTGKRRSRDARSRSDSGSGRAGTARLTWSARFLELFGYAFVCYPVMVLSTVLPPFPLLVNVVVGVCTLGLVVYLVAVPHVGMAVFGAWSLFATVGLLLAARAGMLANVTVPGGGIEPFAALLGFVGLTTWLPFVVSSVVYRGYARLYRTG